MKRDSKPYWRPFHDRYSGIESGDAVTAQPRARIERHETERLGLGSVDDFPHVDVELAANLRDLIHQADVHGAEGILEKLCGFCDPRRAHRMYVVDDLGVHGDGGFGRIRGAAADDLRDAAGIEMRVTRVDAFGRESKQEVRIELEARFLKEREHELFGRSGIGRRLQHYQLPAAHVIFDSSRRRENVRDVGFVGRVERSRHADDDAVAGAKLPEIGGRAQSPRFDRGGDAAGRDVRNVAAAFVDRCGPRRVEIETDGTVAGIREPMTASGSPTYPRPTTPMRARLVSSRGRSVSFAPVRGAGVLSVIREIMRRVVPCLLSGLSGG